MGSFPETSNDRNLLLSTKMFQTIFDQYIINGKAMRSG